MQESEVKRKSNGLRICLTPIHVIVYSMNRTGTRESADAHLYLYTRLPEYRNKRVKMTYLSRAVFKL